MHAQTLMIGIVIATLAPANLSAADTDPLPDPAEAAVCGFPALASVINSLPSAVGRCSGADFVTPVLNPPACPECTSTSMGSPSGGWPLTPAQDVAGVPLLPVGVPSQGPFQSPPVNQPAGTLQGAVSGQRYCITVTPSGSSPLSQCIDIGPAAPFVPPVGPVTLVGVPSQGVGPTPGLPAGGLGSTPPVHVGAASIDWAVSYRWVESHLNQRLGPGLVNVYEPVDLDNANEVSWWANNGNKTTASVSVTLRLDGVPVQTVSVSVPYVGQAIEALNRTT